MAYFSVRHRTYNPNGSVKSIETVYGVYPDSKVCTLQEAEFLGLSDELKKEKVGAAIPTAATGKVWALRDCSGVTGSTNPIYVTVLNSDFSETGTTVDPPVTNPPVINPPNYSSTGSLGGHFTV